MAKKDVFADLGFEPSFEELGFESEDRAPASGPVVSENDALKTGALRGVSIGTYNTLGGGVQGLLDLVQRTGNSLGLASPSPSQVNEQLQSEGFTGKDIQATGALGIAEQGRAENIAEQEQAFEQHPGNYIAGNVLGSIPTMALGGMGALGKGAQALTAARGIGGLAASGAVMGGIGAADTSKSLEDLPLDVAGGALGGGTLGGVLGAVPAVVGGVKGVAKGTMNLLTEDPYVSKLLKVIQKEASGTKLAGNKALEAAKNEMYKLADQLGTGTKNIADMFPKAINKVLKRAEDAGVQIDVNEQLEPFKKKLINILDKTKDPAIRKDIETLLSRVEAFTTKELDVPTSQVMDIEPSARQVLEGKIPKVQEKMRLSGETGQPYIVESPDKSQISLLKPGQGEVAASERAIPKTQQKLTMGEDGVLKWVPEESLGLVDDGLPGGSIPKPPSPLEVLANTPETPVVQEAVQSVKVPDAFQTPSEFIQTKRGLSAMTELGDQSQLGTKYGESLAKEGVGVIKGGESAIPGLQQVNQRASAAMKTLELLGLDKGDFVVNPKTGLPELISKDLQSVTHKIRQAASEQVAAGGADKFLQQALQQLEIASPTLAKKLAPSIANAGENYELARAIGNQYQISQGLLGSIKSQGLKLGAYGGRAAHAVSEKFSNATPDVVKQFASAAASKGGAGAEVSKRFLEAANKDNISRNALLFSMEQNPEFRKILKDLGLGNKED